MRIMRLIAAALLLCLLVSVAGAEGGFLPYDKVKGYQYVSFGRYPQGPEGEEAPILWRVLKVEEGLVYLMSHYILDVQRVNGDQWNYAGFKNSELDLWLNQDFVEQAFTEAERGALREDPDFGRASLPSKEDLKDKALGFGTDDSRRIFGTPWALNKRGLYSYSGRGHSPIWLRERSGKKHAQLATKSGGQIGFIGVESDDLGVCPVIWLDTGKVTIGEGMGTLGSPIVIQVQASGTEVQTP